MRRSSKSPKRADRQVIFEIPSASLIMYDRTALASDIEQSIG